MPLDHGSDASRTRAPSAIDIAALGRHAALLAWFEDETPGDGRRGFRARIDGRPAPPPSAHCAIATGERVLHLLAVPGEAARLAAASLEISGLDGATLAEADRGTGLRSGDLDVVGLLPELRVAERIRLCRFVLEVCPPLFKLARDAEFVAIADAIIQTLSRRPGRLQTHSLAGPLAIYEAAARRGLGNHLTAVAVSRHAVLRAAISPRELASAGPADDIARLGVALDRDVAQAGGTLVIIGETGIACRTLPGELPSLSTFQRARRDKGLDDSLRDFVIDALAAADSETAPTSHVLAELRAATARVPGPVPAAGAVGGAIDCLVGNAGGVAVVGSLEDPHDLVDALVVTRRNRPLVVDLRGVLRFPAAERRTGASGFVFALPATSDAAIPASIEIRARLRSGETVALGSGPTTATPAADAPALLRAATTSGLGADELAGVIGAVLRAAHQSTPGAEMPLIEDIGAAAALPRTSLVTPVGTDPALLRARFAAFALDPTLAETEILFVADDPATAMAARPLLRGLVDLYGRPVRLAVPAAGATPTQALSRAAMQARAPFLALLAATALPAEAGWLDALAGALAARPRAGLVAAQMVHPDGSLVDAGLAWSDAPATASRPLPRLAGFPAAFPGHEAAQHADAVRRGAWFMRRSLFELVDGFDATMMSTLGVDVAFAMRLAMAGFEIWTLGEPRIVSHGAAADDPIRAVREAVDTAVLAARRADIAERNAPAEPAPVPAEVTTLAEAGATAPEEIDADAKPRKRRPRKSRRAA